MTEKTLSNRTVVFIGLVLSLIVVVANIWLYFSYPRPSVDSFKSTDNLLPVDISAVATDGKKLLEGLVNNSNIPIPEPSGKMGRSNPFADL
ncbi:MAG: hypothetical protein Athens101428_317 [Candidatus Berkelbacteria bacterium Athens1014_28]|uniref:Uncharacterized protein n=1 Tax=Candidatus Berkelbacteria bacterium Athens1014_28 TaxID=2017145 RepID=A0A554LN78_9BACT|nr:MAG: hypothetical protein Athens101428_317 [Candidatus Berkelbacteria bacterium Athens1014_28]